MDRMLEKVVSFQLNLARDQFMCVSVFEVTTGLKTWYRVHDQLITLGSTYGTPHYEANYDTFQLAHEDAVRRYLDHLRNLPLVHPGKSIEKFKRVSQPVYSDIRKEALFPRIR